MDPRKWQLAVKRYERKHHVLSALLIGSALVLFWRGVWMLADLYLFPEDYLMSAAVSVLVAFLILYFRDFDLKELFAAH